MHSDPNIYNLDINDELEYLSGEDAKKTENEVLSAADADIEPHGGLSGMQIYDNKPITIVEGRSASAVSAEVADVQ